MLLTLLLVLVVGAAVLVVMGAVGPGATATGAAEDFLGAIEACLSFEVGVGRTILLSFALWRIANSRRGAWLSESSKLLVW